jgi:hypothetical protein
MVNFDSIADRQFSGERWENLIDDAGVDQIMQWIEETHQASLAISPITISFLNYISNHTNQDVRRSAAIALGRYKYSSVIRILLSLLGDKQAEVREAATYSLSRLGSPSVIPLLERMQHDQDMRVRLVAAKALGKETLIRPNKSTPPNIRFMDNYRRRPLSKGKNNDEGFRLSGRPLHPNKYSAREAAQDDASTLTPNRVDSQKPPLHLYGGYTEMRKKNESVKGYIDFISCSEDYSYRFSVGISDKEILGMSKLAKLPKAIENKTTTLKVALISNDSQILAVVDDPPIKSLQVTANENDRPNAVHFFVRGLKEGLSSLQILVYHRGCLVIRSETAPIPVKARPGKVEPFDDELPISDSITATIMSHGGDIAAIAENVKHDRFASLLIDEAKNDKLLLALFYQDNEECGLVSVQAPAESMAVDYESLRDKLQELTEMKSGLIHSVFGDSDNMQVSLKDRQKVLSILRDIGIKLWTDLFANPYVAPIRKIFVKLVSKKSTEGFLQIVSDDVFIPWQLLYVDDKKDEPNEDMIIGLRFQTEHIPAKGEGVGNWKKSQGNEPPISFINRYLPTETVQENEKIFSVKEYDEKKLIKEFTRQHNKRPAIYFYCHAETGERKDKCWIKLTDDRNKLTLNDLERTGYASQESFSNQLEFDCAPLVFLNACESGQIDSRFYISFVNFLLLDKKAGGVIGSETKMPAFFATDFAKKFWESIQNDKKPVGQVLFNLRKDYWRKYNNPLGLMYSLYANAELQVTI